MILKIYYPKKLVRFVELSEYTLGSPKEWYADCLKIVLYSSNGKKLQSKSRPFKWFYEHFTFKTEKVQKLLKEQIESEQEKLTNTNQNKE